ncbi:MAG: hypothetical protein JW981_10190, partial [Anaerolineae bacterium]|nr:hypothetical protein [Anaerolineae bacterium]
MEIPFNEKTMLDETWWDQLVSVAYLDTEQSRLGRLFNTLMVLSLLIALGLSVIFFVTALLANQWVYLTRALFPLAFIPISVLGIVLCKRGLLRQVVIFYVWAGFIGVGLTVFLYGGINSAGWILFLWPVMVIGMLTQPRYSYLS